MPGRFVRSKIAELVADVIGSRQGRELLEQHGWAQGMPIVMAQPHEKLAEVMALVSVHQPPVLVATMDNESRLCFTYVALGGDALEVVDPRGSTDTISDLYSEALETDSFLMFRINQLSCSAVAHAYRPCTHRTRASAHSVGWEPGCSNENR